MRTAAEAQDALDVYHRWLLAKVDREQAAVKRKQEEMFERIAVLKAFVQASVLEEGEPT